MRVYRSRPPWMMWGVFLLVVSLVLAACGGAATPTGEEADTAAEPVSEADTTVEEETTATEAEPAAEEAEPEAMAEEETAGAVETEESATAMEEEEAEATAEEETADQAAENLLDPNASVNQDVSCEPLEIPENTRIAAISQADWALGPEDAPLTVIEYGDFQ